MKIQDLQQFFVVLSSFFFGLLLSIAPLPAPLTGLRPHWTMLVLIFWLKVLPRSIGLWVSWSLGFVVDALQGGGLIGQHSLIFLIIAFLVNMTRNRLRYATYQQQFGWICGLIGVGQLVLFLIEWSIGQMSTGAWYGTSWVLSVVAWPLVSATLDKCYCLAWDIKS